MKIYVAHSREYDYINELYLPIRNHAGFEKHTIILPHEVSNQSSNSRDFYKDIDFMIAECSYPSTGMGIELGWAYDDHIPIYCIHKNHMKISNSINAVTQNIFEYTSIEEMIQIIEDIIKKENKTKVL